jgi:His-Xaa-Ser system protein HxsD
MPPTPQAASSPDEDIVVAFATATHALEPLQAAAYRMIGRAACHIGKEGDQYVCRLSPLKVKGTPDRNLRTEFLDLVTDETLRAQIEAKTEGTRNLILALAFGALAAEDGA